MIRANEIKKISIDRIVPNPKNPNKHSKEQIERLCKLIEFQGFRNPLIISNRSGFLVVGHGRLEAAKKLGFTELPVIMQDFESEAQEYAYVVSDNEIARWAELDVEMLNNDLKNLDIGNIDLLGLKDNDLLANFALKDSKEPSSLDEEEISNYSKKIATPIYSPKKDSPPPISELFKIEKYESLVKEIKDKKLPKEVELFLVNAASRHIVFNYANIAEFYCHQSKDIQELMEKSALVVIDFNKAVENGFVKITEEIKEIMNESGIEVDYDEQD